MALTEEISEYRIRIRSICEHFPFLPCTTFMLNFTLHDFDRYCHYQDGEGEGEGEAKPCTVLDIPHQGPGLHHVIALPSDLLHSYQISAGIIRFLIGWQVSGDCILSLLPDIFTRCRSFVVGDDDMRNPKLLSFYIDIKRVVSVRSNLDRLGASKEIDRMTEEDCPICLEGLVGLSMPVVVRQLPCSHLFHERCILKWLEKNQTCPLCRWKLPRGDQILIYLYSIHISIS
ncbi:hypothetical protein Dimus_024048 [Dionaea muscipula]